MEVREKDREKEGAKENGVSVRLRPAVDCGLELLLPQHSLPASLARGDVFSSGNISGSCSGLAKGAPLAVRTCEQLLEGLLLGYYTAQFGTIFYSLVLRFNLKKCF